MPQKSHQTMTRWTSLSRRKSFPGHPLFDTRMHLPSQVRRMKYYPTLVQFIRRCPMGAREDWRQGAAFLLNYVDQPNTYSQYRGSLQSFLNYLWCIRRKTLRTASGADIGFFIELCHSPPTGWQSTGRFAAFRGSAEDRWGNPDWRPFLSTTPNRQSATHTKTHVIVRTFLSSLSHSGYLRKMPGPSSPTPSRQRNNPQKPGLKALTDSQWAFLVRHLEKIATQKPEMERSLFAVMMLKSLFLRVSDLARMPGQGSSNERYAKMADLIPRSWRGRTIWFLRVKKRREGNVRWIPVPEECWPYIERYRRTLGLPAHPSQPEKTPLLPGKRQTALSKRQLERVVHSAMLSAAIALETEGRWQEARRFRELAGKTDCLRHTGAIQALANGCSVHQLSRWIGHRSIDNTIDTYRIIGFRDIYPP